jgi:formylglycine-generating enzyme required for sulfatase activity
LVASPRCCIDWIGLAGALALLALAATAATGEPVAGETFKDCAGCPEMVVVPAGTFSMGSPADEQGRFADEGPQYAVTISTRLAVGKLAVTLDQFAAFVRETGYDAGSQCYSWSGGNWTVVLGRSWRNPGFPQNGSHPVVCVSFNDAKAYAAWLAKKTGKSYRLLSEAEWEYAARAGSTTRYPFGDNDDEFCRHGNGADRTVKKGMPDWTVLPCDDGHLYTAPGGTFRANAFGLHDMLGNAWQWMQDCYNPTYKDAPADGSASTAGDCESRVLRGGSWASNPRHLRSAARIGNNPDVRGNSRVGFRVARTLD